MPWHEQYQTSEKLLQSSWGGGWARVAVHMHFAPGGKLDPDRTQVELNQKTNLNHIGREVLSLSLLRAFPRYDITADGTQLPHVEKSIILWFCKARCKYLDANIQINSILASVLPVQTFPVLIMHENLFNYYFTHVLWSDLFHLGWVRQAVVFLRTPIGLFWKRGKIVQKQLF